MFLSTAKATIVLREGLRRPPVPSDVCSFEGVDVFCIYDGVGERVRIGTLEEMHGAGHGEVVLRSSGNAVEIPATLRFGAVPVSQKVSKKRPFVEPSKAERSHVVKDGGVVNRKQRTLGGFVKS